MGNKYIPTYYDQIDENYRNKSVNPEPGKCGWKPNCPPILDNYTGPGLNCNRCTPPNNGQGQWEYPPAIVTSPGSRTNTWNDCDNRNPYLPPGSTEPIMIPNAKCACGWPKEEPITNICSPENWWDGFLKDFLLSDPPPPGVVNGDLSTGGSRGVY
jgi:hypothetical protein